MRGARNSKEPVRLLTGSLPCLRCGLWVVEDRSRLSAPGTIVAAIAPDHRARCERMSGKRPGRLDARQNRSLVVGAVAALARGGSLRIGYILMLVHPRSTDGVQSVRASIGDGWNG